MRTMNDREALARLKELNAAATPHIVSAHKEADRVLCELLNKLGHGLVVEQFEALAKGYGDDRPAR